MISITVLLERPFEPASRDLFTFHLILLINYITIIFWKAVFLSGLTSFTSLLLFQNCIWLLLCLCTCLFFSLRLAVWKDTTISIIATWCGDQPLPRGAHTVSFIWTPRWVSSSPDSLQTLIFHFALLFLFCTYKYSYRLIKMTGRWASTYPQLYLTVQPGIQS